MALIVEIGKGLVAATENTYVTVAESDTYNELRGRETTWIDLDTELKEQHLIIATQQMEAVFRTLWKGKKRLSDDATSPTANDPLVQALSWPRKDVKDEDTVLLDRKVIPPLVKDAQIEIAFILAGGDQFVQSSIDRNTTGTIREKVGPIDIMFQENAQAIPWFPFIDQLLQPLTGSPGFNKLSIVVGLTAAEQLEVDKTAAFDPLAFPEFFINI